MYAREMKTSVLLLLLKATNPYTHVELCASRGHGRQYK